MAELEERLGAILADPGLMSQIQAMAGSLGGQAPKQEQPPETQWLARLTGLARQTGIDPQEQALLKALQPYLSPQRLGKLERAMRAAKLAGFAAGALGQNRS